jgi:simple sugar transport system ATP-binding protein
MRKKALAEVQKKIDEFGFNLDPKAMVRDISVAAQQKVEILKLLYRNVSVLIMDETDRSAYSSRDPSIIQ